MRYTKVFFFAISLAILFTSCLPVKEYGTYEANEENVKRIEKTLSKKYTYKNVHVLSATKVFSSYTSNEFDAAIQRNFATENPSLKKGNWIWLVEFETSGDRWGDTNENVKVIMYENLKRVKTWK